MSQPNTIPIYPLTPAKTVANAMPLASTDVGLTLPFLDALARPLQDLRISVTDRCNFRCTYCMPKSIFTPDYPYLSRTELLDFEEITRFATIAVKQGIEKICLTGGEPLLRKNLPDLVHQLKHIAKVPDLTLTTNAALLAKFVPALKAAGLDRITVSLDALEDPVFKQMNDADFSVEQVLDGIKAAQMAGFNTIKVNCVVQKGVNEHQVIPLAQYFKGSGIAIRFIEFMDVGVSNGWLLTQVVPSQQLIDSINALTPIHPAQKRTHGEVAQRWVYADGTGELGFISSVTQPFCGGCTRLRLSTNGQLFTCLFAQTGWDLRTLLRDKQTSDAQLAQSLRSLWAQRNDQYSVQRAASTVRKSKIEMSFIGG